VKNLLRARCYTLKKKRIGDKKDGAKQASHTCYLTQSYFEGCAFSVWKPPPEGFDAEEEVVVAAHPVHGIRKKMTLPPMMKNTRNTHMPTVSASG